MTSIVVVEDHAAFAQALTRLLSGQGSYDVETIPTGEQALERLQRSSADLVLIDISLPGRNGIWLLNALRDVNPTLHCLMLSGYANKDYVQQSMDAGACGYVLKEDLPGLRESIRQALRGGVYISPALRDI